MPQIVNFLQTKFFMLGRRIKSISTAEKNILKVVKLQRLVAKCYKKWNI